MLKNTKKTSLSLRHFRFNTRSIKFDR